MPLSHARAEGPLQRLFSTFPSGRPGVGLLLLRTALGGISAALGGLELSSLNPRTPVVWAVACILLVSGMDLIVGFLTPFASLVAGLCILAISLSWVPAPPLGTVGAALIAVLMVVTCLGIALLGPGAFSLDGHLFGRREIIIPPRSPES